MSRSEGECYSLRRFKGQTKKAFRVLLRDKTEVVRVVAARRGQLAKRMNHPRRLVSLSSERYRREIRRIRFDQETIAGHSTKQIVVSPFSEGDDAAERDIPAGVNREFREPTRARVAVQHTRHTRGARLTQHSPGVVLRFPGMDDKRLAHFRRKRDLGRKGGALRIARRVVVMIVQAALSDGNRGVSEQRMQAWNVARLIELRGVVRMDASGREYETWICGSHIGSRCRDCQRLADTDDGSRARIAGASDYLVAVAGERRVREVGVAVDED